MNGDAYIDYLVAWLREQVERTGAKGLVVGVSGGIDSAVVANLIKRACPDNSLGVIMPCNSNPQDQDDAEAVIAAAGIERKYVDLTSTRELMLLSMTPQMNPDADNLQLVDGNLRARLRMSTLYAIAQSYGYLVVGTDNAAEWYTGYFTKFGDGGVDLVPLVHVTKHGVAQMAQTLQVPEQVIHKAPSAGLWEDQTDEDEMGVSYAMIDALLLGEDIPEAKRQIIERLHTVSAHKRTGAVQPEQKPDYSL